MKDTLRQKTPRLNGRNLELLIADVNGVLRGWFEYFKHTNVGTKFPALESWLRRRVRRILLKRNKYRRHNGLGTAHHRWPNASFAEHGLFSLTMAHARAAQSAGR